MSKINRLMDLSTPRDNSGNTRFDHESIKTLEILDRYFSNSDVNPEAVMAIREKLAEQINLLGSSRPT
ncbi:hypothetical protein [Endozoicomonas sp.]|uniref:hypothetical protein n=1 Tax=Endozoicomonas sp. TaxID=1892382 RepID=UPI003AF6263F